MILELSQQPAHATQEKILDAASNVFAADGFGRARVDEIARRADVNKALLYYHVGNKQALYTAVLMRNFDRIDEVLAEAIAPGGSARDRLSAVILGITRALRAHPDHPRIVLRELAASGRNLQPEVLERLKRVVGMVRRLLADGVRDGDFRATEPVMTHLTLIGASLILNATAPLRDHLWEIAPGFRLPDDGSDVAEFLSDLLVNGIAAPKTGEAT